MWSAPFKPGMLVTACQAALPISASAQLAATHMAAEATFSLSALAGSEGQLRPSWKWPRKCHMRMGACKRSCTPTGKKCASWNPLAMLAHRRLKSCRLNSGINAACIHVHIDFNIQVLMSESQTQSSVLSVTHICHSLTHALFCSPAHSLTHSRSLTHAHSTTGSRLSHPHLPLGVHGD